MFCQRLQLFVQRCLHPVVNLSRHKHFSVFRVMPYGKDLSHSVSCHHLRPAHHVVHRIGLAMVAILAVGTFYAKGLPCKRRFVYTQRDGFQ